MQTSTSAYDNAAYIFPSFDPDSQMRLRSIVLKFMSMAKSSLELQFYLSLIGALITAAHLIILTRKSMRKSSIVPIMIGISIGDLTTMITTVVVNCFMFTTEGSACVPPVSMFAFHIFWLSAVVRDLVRRSSTWLGVAMALIRYLMIKCAAKPEIQGISRVNFGFTTVVLIYAVSTVLSIIYYFRYDLVEEGTWRPMQNCTNIPLDTIGSIPIQKPSTLFTMYNGLFGKTYMLVNGIFSKILPCILLPPLTILLISVIRQAGVERQITSIGPRKSRERTTGLVIFMAVSFFVVELPLGITLIGQVACTDYGYL
uniref:G_PROTEIN_RECEP_F1_2 domain-containing protein n=1 Tax=Caenorhabditis japonica TaxID=281687 RepID=A0A8R1DS16_CAEJA